ncbi:unnamed protein product [Rhizophagus irregularis]|nr:unnamed protein product [Rhizophagus irregularis]
MSCSKIFSGDLPELIYEIIKNFQNDYSTLHSCILVNRLWCRLAIPLLWENPFSITTGNYNFIEVYLYNLNDYLKTKINDYQIINYLLPSNTLFNYPSFIKYLNICKIALSIERCLKANYKASNSVNLVTYTNSILASVFEFEKLINMSLIKLFIENEVNLHTLEIGISTAFYKYYNVYVDISEMILQNPNFIHNIRNLSLSAENNHCKNALIKNYISQIISLHQNLKRILFGHKSLSLYQSLLLSKEFNCSNTLNTIIFCEVSFNGNCQNELILQNLGQILPSKLEYLSLTLRMIKVNDFEVFLKNSQDTFFKKLLISNLVREYSDDIDILPYIKEYIMKKKRVQYLAIKNTSSTFSISKGKDVDLSNFKDEVKEFKLHNIIVLKYIDLFTDVNRFINEID